MEGVSRLGRERLRGHSDTIETPARPRASNETTMNFRKHFLEAATLIVAAVLCVFFCRRTARGT